MYHHCAVWKHAKKERAQYKSKFWKGQKKNGSSFNSTTLKLNLNIHFLRWQNSYTNANPALLTPSSWSPRALPASAEKVTYKLQIFSDLRSRNWTGQGHQWKGQRLDGTTRKKYIYTSTANTKGNNHFFWAPKPSVHLLHFLLSRNKRIALQAINPSKLYLSFH